MIIQKLLSLVTLLSIGAGEAMAQKNNTGYNAGHPWYYIRGGSILKPREISAAVKVRGYQGYMADDIIQADKRPEPQRSEALRSIKANVLKSFWDDLSHYRALATQLRKYRQTNDPKYAGKICDDIHTSISLKHNHIYNDLAHLHFLDDCLSKQKDLFDL